MIFLDTSILSVSYRRKYRQEVEKPSEEPVGCAELAKRIMNDDAARRVMRYAG